MKSSVVLMNDIEEIRAKVDRTQTRIQLGDVDGVKEKGDAVVSCYRYASVFCRSFLTG